MADYALGKHPAIIHADTLRLQKYLTPQLPSPPASADFTSGIAAWPMYGNDRKPDCTAAAAAHMSEIFSLRAGIEYIPEEPEVEALWLGANGGKTNEGAYELNLLKYWQKHPLKGNVAPYAYVSVNWRDQAMVKTALSLFAGLFIGLAMPLSAQNQIGTIWTKTDGLGSQWGSWGGHAVNLVAFDTDGLTCVTWGALQRMTWDFFDYYCDECWCILASDWKGALGIDFNALVTDLQEVTGSSNG